MDISQLAYCSLISRGNQKSISDTLDSITCSEHQWVNTDKENNSEYETPATTATLSTKLIMANFSNVKVVTYIIEVECML